MAVGAAAGNLVACTSGASQTPETRPASTQAASDEYLKGLALTAEQFNRVNEVAKATAVARIDFMKGEISHTDPTNQRHSIYNGDDGSLWMTSDVQESVAASDYDLKERMDLLVLTPAQSANGLDLEIQLIQVESCYATASGQSESVPCDTGGKYHSSSLKFTNPNSAVFTDYLLTEEEVRAYLTDSNTTLTAALKNEESVDADGNVDSNFDAVELDGSTVDASGTRDGIMESLTRATNF